MSAASKAAWRARNPERSREAERSRAQSRRSDAYTNPESSYQRYESSYTRFSQRMWYPIRGAGGHRMTVKQGRAAIDARSKLEWAAFGERFGLTQADVARRRASVALLVAEAVAKQ